MSRYKLVAELSGDVIHEGSEEECMLIKNAFEKYGIRADKFNIVYVYSTVEVVNE